MRHHRVMCTKYVAHSKLGFFLSATIGEADVDVVDGMGCSGREGINVFGLQEELGELVSSSLSIQITVNLRSRLEPKRHP